jgi:hypothetical protein
MVGIARYLGLLPGLDSTHDSDYEPFEEEGMVVIYRNLQRWID